MKRLVEANGAETVMALLDAFFLMPDAWVVKCAHDLFTLEHKLQEVNKFMGTGKFVSMQEVREQDKQVQGKVDELAFLRGKTPQERLAIYRSSYGASADSMIAKDPEVHRLVSGNTQITGRAP